MTSLFFLYCDAVHPALHSFPTRRSSDLYARAVGAYTRAIAAYEQAGFHRGIAESRHNLGITYREQGRLDRSEEHTSELQSHSDLVCRLLLEKKNPGVTSSGSIDGQHGRN